MEALVEIVYNIVCGMRKIGNRKRKNQHEENFFFKIGGRALYIH